MSFWEKHPLVYGHSAICLVVVGAIFLLLCMIVPLSQPWTLPILEIMKDIPIPRFLLNDSTITWLSRGISKYFDSQIVYDGIAPRDFQSKRLIKCMMPHGVIPFGIACVYNQIGFESPRNTYVVAHQLYNFPLLVQCLRYLKFVPASYDLMKNAIHTYRSLVLFPGGVRETFMTSHKKEVIVIKKRKGVFRLALETGIPLVPCYTFGLSILYERSGVSITLPFFFKNDKDSVAWFYGKYYTPYPMKKRLLTVIGEVIPVEHIKNPTEKDIRRLRRQYKKAVRNLFDKWKGKYCSQWKERKLVFR
jgi:2-acylglycerol O-acyltransferase 2